MFISSRGELLDFIRNKRIAILAFNKDARSLLKFWKSKITSVEYDLAYVIDPSLTFRPRVKTLLEDVFDSNRVLTQGEEISKSLCGSVDVVLCFDKQDERFYPPRQIDSFSDLSNVLEDDFANYKKFSNKAEFNFRWRRSASDFVLSLAARSDIFVMYAYWNGDLLDHVPRPISGGANAEHYIDVVRTGFIRPIHRFGSDFRSARVRIILGSDYAVGKTSFLFNRMREGHSGIAGDLWFCLVSNNSLPPIYHTDYSTTRGMIVAELYEAWKSNPSREIYLRLGGTLEQYTYGIPMDARPIIEGLNKYFRNLKFIVVLKPEEKIDEFHDMFNDFCVMFGPRDNIVTYQMNYDGTEKEVNIP